MKERIFFLLGAVPNQKNSRALFARVGRSYTRLTVEQAEAWAAFAAAYAFGSRMRTQSPAVNAYVTLNCNRALLGLDVLAWPPTEIPAIPDVEYRNLIVTPGLIQFSRLVNPQQLPRYEQDVCEGAEAA